MAKSGKAWAVDAVPPGKVVEIHFHTAGKSEDEFADKLLINLR